MTSPLFPKKRNLARNVQFELHYTESPPGHFRVEWDGVHGTTCHRE